MQKRDNLPEPPTYHLTVATADGGRTIRSLLQAKSHMSTRLLRQLPSEGGVLRNGVAARFNERTAAGDSIVVRLPMESSDVSPVAMALDIRYEDEEIVVVNKPPGLLTHPTARERLGAIQSGLCAYLAPSGRVPHCVHRLDRGTSGLIMFAKHAHAHHLFDEALRRGLLHRVYAALVRCDPVLPMPDGWQSVELPIAEDPDKPSRRLIDADGQRAVTHFRYINRHGDMALLQVVLETGRTHQIRLHMAAQGMPLIGDPDYGDAAKTVSAVLHRQALHAIQLGWRHPVTDEHQVATALPPADLRATWKRAGGDDADWDGLMQDTLALHRVRIV